MREAEGCPLPTPSWAALKGPACLKQTAGSCMPAANGIRGVRVSL